MVLIFWKKKKSNKVFYIILILLSYVCSIYPIYNIHLLKTICESWEDVLAQSQADKFFFIFYLFLEIVPRHYLNSEPCLLSLNLYSSLVASLWIDRKLFYFPQQLKTAYNAHFTV